MMIQQLFEMDATIFILCSTIIAVMIQLWLCYKAERILIKLIPVALLAAGCTRNRDAPTRLAPARLTSIGVNTYLWRAAIDTLSFDAHVSSDFR